MALELACTGLPLWHPVAKIDHELRVYNVTHDADLEGTLVEAAERFWRDHVEKKVPPPPTGEDIDNLKALYPKDQGEIREANAAELALLRKLFPAKLDYEAAEEAFKEIKAQVIGTMGELAGLVAPGLGKVSYKWARGRTVTNWESLARSYKPTPLEIEQHTHVQEGVRRFLVTPEKEGKPRS